MARKQPPKGNQTPKPKPDPATMQDIGDLKRDVSGVLRDIADCRRDVADCRHEVTDAVRKRRFWAICVMSVVGFVGFTSLGTILYIQKQILNAAKNMLTKQVETLYEEKNVARVANEVIWNDANNLISKKVDAEVNPIVQNLRRTQEEQSKTLIEFKKNQEKYAKLTLLHDLAIRAESGELQALKGLAEVTKLPDAELAQVAEGVAVHGVRRKEFCEAGIFDWREAG